ncbi:hypothetical protein CJU89_5831 [Yarrowia sp. B02]|nr:hypothetical protein CJU89_5831 [Yarrowia sp. B02]
MTIFFFLLQACLALAQVVLPDPITSLSVHHAVREVGFASYDWQLWVADISFAFDSDVTINAGDYFEFTLSGSLNPYSSSSAMPLTYDFYVEGPNQEQLFHVVAVDDDYTFRVTATDFFDDPAVRDLVMASGEISVEFHLSPGTPAGDQPITVGSFSGSVTVIANDTMGVFSGTEKVKILWRHEGDYIFLYIWSLFFHGPLGDTTQWDQATFWNKVEVISGFEFEAEETTPWGAVDAFYTWHDTSRFAGAPPPYSAGAASPFDSYVTPTEMQNGLSSALMPPYLDQIDGMRTVYRAIMTGDRDTPACFRYTGNYRRPQLQTTWCIHKGHGPNGRPNGVGLATVEYTFVPVTSFVPGPVPGTTLLIDSNGELYEQVTRTPVSTVTVPGTVEGTASLSNSDGEFYEEVTATPVSTATVPGSLAGTETVTDSEGNFFERVTATPVSTTTTFGLTAGTETLTDSEGNFYERVTATPVSTNTVPGTSAGSATLIDPEGNYYEQITATPVSTATVAGPYEGTETLTNSDGDFYEQVTSVSTSVSLSTLTVPGSLAGTESITNSQGTFVQVTQGIVSTETVAGPSAGTETLTNSDGDYYERVTAEPAETIETSSEVSTEVTSSEVSKESMSSEVSTLSSDPSTLKSTVTETVITSVTEESTAEDTSPVSTNSVVGPTSGTETLTKTAGEPFEQVTFTSTIDPTTVTVFVAAGASVPTDPPTGETVTVYVTVSGGVSDGISGEGNSGVVSDDDSSNPSVVTSVVSNPGLSNTDSSNSASNSGGSISGSISEVSGPGQLSDSSGSSGTVSLGSNADSGASNSVSSGPGSSGPASSGPGSSGPASSDFDASRPSDASGTSGGSVAGSELPNTDSPNTDISSDSSDPPQSPGTLPLSEPQQANSALTLSVATPDGFPAFPDYLPGEEDIEPLSPVSQDIDNLGSCPCCSQELTVSLVHHNTGLITCNNLDCIYPFNKDSILSHFIHIPTSRILRETTDRMKSLEDLSKKTIGIIDKDYRNTYLYQ